MYLNEQYLFLLAQYACMFSTADLEIRNVPFPICPRDTYGSHLELTWLSPKNIIYYCPRCSKSIDSVGSVKNLLSCSGTHSKGLSSVCHSGPVRTIPELKATRNVHWFDSMCASLSSLALLHLLRQH